MRTTSEMLMMKATAKKARAGLSRADRGGMKVGDNITVDGVMAKDGTDFGLIKDVKFPDGRVFTIWTGDPNGK